MHKEFFEVLRKDHEFFKNILLQLKQTTGMELKRREELFGDFKLEIEPHIKAEEEVFYPELEKNRESYEDVLESIEEHHLISLILSELDQTPKQLDQWKAKLRVGMEVLEHHILDEEDKLFKSAIRLLDKEQMGIIYEGFLKARERLKSNLK